jgi:NB-ARC domain/Trypsin-like peptidase domain
VLVGGKDCGAGFAVGPRLVVTAGHVVHGCKDQPVVYVPAGGEAVGVDRVQPDDERDAAILWLASDVGEFLPASAAVQGAEWRVQSPPPGGNDPELHGTVSAARLAIHKASGQRVEVVQLKVDEHLGDFGGYSGSAVLDSLGRAVLALLIEQKPLRTAVDLGERPAASNVLYAVSIGDVITACGLLVRTATPLRYVVGPLPADMMTRSALLDAAVGRVIVTAGGGTGAGLVLLRGPGGAGKTVLARQVAKDRRVWAGFPDGIIMLRAGQAATADDVNRQLQGALGYQDRDLADALAGQRLLLIVDDVWDNGLLTALRGNLPGTVTVLATTRGVFVPGAVLVEVGAVSRDEAICMLARGLPRSAELEQVLGDLAETLFRWALLLTLAAAEIHRDDELDPGFGDEDDSPQPEPGVVIERARTLRNEFLDDPTRLDDLAPTPEAAAPRSVGVMVLRSLQWLGPEHRARFEQLAIYPADALINQPMLEDLWDTSKHMAGKELQLLARAGLAERVGRNPLVIELHDLISAWLHHACGGPGDARHQPAHQRLAGLCLRPDGSPGELTPDRAQWLGYHLVAAAAWDGLKALPAPRWRSAFMVATGSDAAFLATLEDYGHAAASQAPDPYYHAVRAWLFAAHVRALIGGLPIPVVVAMALVGDPVAAITQACQHPQAGEAVPAVLAAVADHVDTRFLERTLAAAQAIPDNNQRSSALAHIAWQLAAIDPRDPSLIDRALVAAEITPDDRQRAQTLSGIAGQLAAADPRDPSLIDRALAVAGTIPGDLPRDWALSGIAQRLAGADPPDPALIERAVAVAGTIYDGARRSQMLAGIAQRLAVIDPARAAALIDQAVAVTIPDDERGETLADIAGELAGADPPVPALIDRALAVAGTIPEKWRRSGVLAGIAGRLAVIDPARAAALIDQAVAVAGTVPADERGTALAGIAKWLAAAAPRDATLIDQAVAVAGAVPADERGAALANIARSLAAADPPDPALIDRALSVAGTIPEEWRRRDVLADIARRLAAADPLDLTLIDRAVAVARTIPDDDYRSSGTLADIAERLAAAGPRDASLIERAVAVAVAIPGDGLRERTLAPLAEQLAAADPGNPVLIERAVAVAVAIPSAGQSSVALTGIAQRLEGIDHARAVALIDQALALAGTTPDGPRIEPLAGIAQRLAVIDPARAVALIHQAVGAAERLPYDGGHRYHALAAVAGRLAAADPTDPALIDQALAVAGAIPDSRGFRSAALAAVAGQLAAGAPRDAALIERALAVAGTIPDGERGAALAAVAGRLAAADPADPVLIDRAVAVAVAIGDDAQRIQALAAIAQCLDVIDPDRSAALSAQAQAMAETIAEDRWPGAVLAAIDDWLTSAGSADPALVDQAVADVIPDRGQRGAALAAMAGQLAATDPRDPALIERAVALTGMIPDLLQRGDALVAIAQQLAADPRDPALVEQAVALAGTLSDEFRRQSQALTVIAQQLAAADPLDLTLVERALAVAGTIPDDSWRSDALAAIAERLATAGPGDPALVDRAIAVAETITEASLYRDTFARINIVTRGSLLEELSGWRLRSLSDSIDLLAFFLAHSHDQAIAASIGRAVLEVTQEFSG